MQNMFEFVISQMILLIEKIWSFSTVLAKSRQRIVWQIRLPATGRTAAGGFAYLQMSNEMDALQEALCQQVQNLY